jgi:hypothetical protein
MLLPMRCWGLVDVSIIARSICWRERVQEKCCDPLLQEELASAALRLALRDPGQ